MADMELRKRKYRLHAHIYRPREIACRFIGVADEVKNSISLPLLTRTNDSLVLQILYPAT
jgi:hypothetical protein